MIKRNILLGLITLTIISLLVIVSCAYTTDTTSNIITPQPNDSSTIYIEHLYGGAISSYTLDYVEDKDRNVGCYIYDGSESGSLFCFELDK